MPAPALAPQPNTAFFSTVLNDPSTTNSSTTSPSTSSRVQQQQHQHHRTTRPADTSPFTAAQRSAQARHKDYDVSASGRLGKKEESYEQRQQRDEAACILDSSEMLMWFAASRNESIPQTRHYYQNIVLGVAGDEELAWREEWEVGFVLEREEGVGSPARSGKGKEREGQRAKKRVSSAHELKS